MFVAMARKLGTALAAEDVPAIPQRGALSGADIEGLVGRALRRSLLAGEKQVTRETLAEVVGQFLPSTEGMERDLQEIAAILECTDLQFLPPEIRERMIEPEGRERVQERYANLRRMVELA